MVKSDLGQRSALTLVDEAHRRTDEALQRVEQLAGRASLDGFLRWVGEGAGGTHQELLTAYDAVLVEVSQHVLGVEVAVLPTVLQSLPEGHSRARAQLQRSRQLETTIRSIEQLLYGDAHAPSHRLDRLHHELLGELDAHCQEEAQVLRDLEAALDPAERAALATRLDRATRRAPTRPHPHALRRLSWSRLLYRPIALWDRLLDGMDSRMSGSPKSSGRPRPGLWSSYLLGTPLPPRSGRGEEVRRRP